MNSIRRKEPAKPPSRSKCILFSVIITALILLSLEGILRIAGLEYHNIPRYIQFADDKYKYPERRRGGYDFIPDRELFWRLTRNNPRFQTNSKGYRGREFPARKPDGIFRIIALGGSCTFGLGSPFSYASALQFVLNQNSAEREYEVINTGVPGYTSFQGLKLLRTELIGYQPDLIIVYFGWNDHWLARFYQDKEQKQPSSSALFALDLVERCRIVQATTMLVSSIRRSVSKSASDLQFRVSQEDYEDNLREMVRTARSGGAAVVLITAPMAYRDGANVPDHLSRDGFIANKEALPAIHSSYNEIVRKVAASSGAVLGDCARYFDQVSDKEGLFSNDGIHPNRAGHRVIMELLFKKLISNGIISDEDYDLDMIGGEAHELLGRRPQLPAD